MIINNNIPAMNTHRQMGMNQQNMQSSMEKLSSGMQINRAGDDAAGLSISEKMRAQINGLDQASNNAQDGISLIQTAEGALDESHSILQRMRELTVQAGNETNQDEDLDAIQNEITALQQELGGSEEGSQGISDRTQFNGIDLLNGNLSDDGEGDLESISFQIGANQGQQLEMSIGDMSAEGLGVDAINVTGFGDEGDTSFDAQLGDIDAAIATVSETRSELGATQNRLEHTISNLDNASENLSAAESRIRDVDMASEMMKMTQANILSQASQSMLAQANQQPQAVLQLLG